MKDKIVMITGSSGQIGQALVEAILRNEGKVVAIDLDNKILKEKLAKNGLADENILYLNTDIANLDQVNKAYEDGIRKFGKITTLINNAGSSVFTSWKNRSEDEIDLVTNVNLKGTFYCTRKLIEHCMVNNTEGVILNIASHYGIISPDPRIYTDCDRRNSEIYGATKAGIIQMTKYFSVNAILDGADIRINAIAPGGIYNPNDPQGKEFIKNYSERCPMGRLGETHEIIGPALFLISSESSYINGHTLVVDGGMTAW